MNCSLPKPRLFMGCSCNPSSWALDQATLPRRGPSSQDTVLVEWASSCCISLFSVSLQCYLRALADSVVPAKLLDVLHIKDLLAYWWPWEDSPFSQAQCCQAGCGRWGGVHSHFLRIFCELSTVRPSQCLHFKAWHDKRVKSLGISPLSLNHFISSWAKVRANSSNTRHSVQRRNR